MEVCRGTDVGDYGLLKDIGTKKSMLVSILVVMYPLDLHSQQTYVSSWLSSISHYLTFMLGHCRAEEVLQAECGHYLPTPPDHLHTDLGVCFCWYNSTLSSTAPKYDLAWDIDVYLYVHYNAQF